MPREGVLLCEPQFGNPCHPPVMDKYLPIIGTEGEAGCLKTGRERAVQGRDNRRALSLDGLPAPGAALCLTRS
jgi:hypothetical protein